MSNPIRILHVVGIMNLGGIETFLMSALRNIDRTQINFDFVVHGKGVFDDEIRSLGGRVFYLPRIGKNPLNLNKWKNEFRNVLANNHFDAVESHMLGKTVLILKIAKEIGIQTRIAHSHFGNIPFRSYLRAPHFWFFFFLNKHNYAKYATTYFGTTQNAGDKEFGEKISRSKDYQIIRLAIDTEKFKFSIQERNQVREKLNVDSNTLLIGHIGRFEIHKNQIFLIKILPQIIQKNPNVKLLLIGDYSRYPQAQKLIQRYHLEHYVITPGCVENPNTYYAAMDLFLMPSIFEPFGIVSIEAQCSGLPAIISQKLPKEAALFETTHPLPLDEKRWIDAITHIQPNSLEVRPQYSMSTKEKGWDIHDEIKKLQSIYIQLVNSCKLKT